MALGEKLTALLLRNALGSFGTVFSPRLSILIFHRVHAVPDPLFPFEPDAERFESLMRFVAATFRVMTLGEAVDHLLRDTLPPRSLVITFDDGYADNAEVALPILQRLGLRATFFISTGFLDGGRMWNDSVIESVRASSKDSIDLAVFGLARQSMRTVEDRRRCIDALLPKIKYLPLLERVGEVLRLQHLCGVGSLPDDLMMSTPQLQSLHRAGMEVGAHTVNHPILKSISAKEAEREISDGRHALESLLDTSVDVFAYPNGKPGKDYDAAHVEIVRKLGFRCAVSTAPGVGRAGDDLFQLPRFTPWGRSTLVWGGRLALNQMSRYFERVPLHHA